MGKPKIIQLFDVEGYDLVYIDLRNICTATVNSGFRMNVLTINGIEYKVSDQDLKARDIISELAVILEQKMEGAECLNGN